MKVDMKIVTFMYSLPCVEVWDIAGMNYNKFATHLEISASIFEFYCLV